jgi:hemolysin activation/secretion protein
VLRWSSDWTYRDRNQVLAARSLVSWGLDILGATSAPRSGRDPRLGELPDGRYLAWLGQAQWARRFELGDWFRPVARLRLDLQLSSDPLLAFERFSIGGHASVRGFRENQLVADQGLVASAELRLPVLWGPGGRAIAFVTPFYDLGHAFNRDRPTPGRSTLQSVGASLSVEPLAWLAGELIVGVPVDGDPDGDTLQEQGVSFRVSMRF